MTTPAGDGATVSVRVEVPPADAFEVFTAELDLWWRRGPRFRAGSGGGGRLALEPRPGGLLVETLELPDGGTRAVELGRVTAWDPPRRVELAWRNVNFAPGERTVVEVTFVEAGGGEATLVTVRHRGWAALRPDHPARHGLDAPGFLRMLGLWWGDQLTALRLRAEARPPRP